MNCFICNKEVTEGGSITVMGSLNRIFTFCCKCYIENPTFRYMFKKEAFDSNRLKIKFIGKIDDETKS